MIDACGTDHCITCSDEALPLRVLVVRGDVAVCEGGLEVMTDLVPDVRPGDAVLVHAGVAIARDPGAGRRGAR